MRTQRQPIRTLDKLDHKILRLLQQDGRIVRVTSPLDHSVTHGNLCIKGRFGWQFVQIQPVGKQEK